MSTSIFLNYRRDDEPFCAGRLYDWLCREFAQEVFMDIDGIEPGLDFVHVLEARVAQCDVLLALIGRGWLNALDENGNRRLQDENDFVRIEIASALKQQKRVIPVLAGSVGHIRADTLPEDLKQLARRQSARISHERFASDVKGLVPVIKKALQEADEGRLAEAQSTPSAAASTRGIKYRRAFLSYALEDRVEVLRRVNALKLSGIEVDGDVLSMEPGERWQQKLFQRIDTCDLFLLFWSKAAAKSKWVAQETEYAVRLQANSEDARPDIIPVVLELPVPRPPPHLAHLHFSNRFSYLADADKAANRRDL